MNCDQAHELFSDYITGDLDPALRVKVENHVTESDACRDVLEGMRQLWSELDHLPTVEPPVQFHSNFMARLNAELDAPPFEEPRGRVWDLRSLFRVRSLALAAALLICALAGIEVVQTQTQPAALGPFSALIQWLHPSATAHLHSATAKWASPSGAPGTLVVRLQTDPSGDARSGTTTFTVTLKRKLSDLPVDQQPILASEKVSLGANELRTVSLKLDEMPTPATCTLEVTAPAEGKQAQSLPVALPTN